MCVRVCICVCVFVCVCVHAHAHHAGSVIFVHNMSIAACGAFILLVEISNSFEVPSLDDEYALLGFALDGIRRVVHRMSHDSLIYVT